MKKKVSINPSQSKLDFKGYDNYFRYIDQRGFLDVWWQPSNEILKSFFDSGLGMQIQSAIIKPGDSPRGNHYHPHEKAFDIFYFQRGEMILVLENLERTQQEIYHLKARKVLVFPPYVAHAVYNIGNEPIYFTTLKTYNHELNKLSVPRNIEILKRDFSRVQKTFYEFPKVGERGMKKSFVISKKIN
jgi:mannose-6-phosphate isomerase-like protein (cupin superfamily)